MAQLAELLNNTPSAWQKAQELTDRIEYLYNSKKGDWISRTVLIEKYEEQLRTLNQEA